MIRIDKKQEGTTLQELVQQTGPYPYKILLARVNGLDTELTETVSAGDEVEFLDMRDHSAGLVYQRMLSILYLTAVNSVYRSKGIENVRAIIDNSLNQGFFTRLEGAGEITEETVAEIETCMRRMVEADLPLRKDVLTREKAIRRCNSLGYHEQAELIAEIKKPGLSLPLYNIETGDDEHGEAPRYYLFGPMAPSLGCIGLFELMKYHDAILLRFPLYSNPDVIPPYSDDANLYETFEAEHEWLELLHTNYLADMNRIISRGGTKDLILLSEALHEKKIAEIADDIYKKGKRIILVAGPSSSGKTTFANRLCTQLRVNGLQPVCIGTDDYFINRSDMPFDENGEQNFEDLEAVDTELLSRNLNDLLAGKEVDLPEFDFIEGVKRFGRRIMNIEANQPIVIEGIHALNDRLTEQVDASEKYKVYISPLTQLNIDTANRMPTTDARMIRRMVRDNKFRGHSATKTIMEWPKVRAGEHKNIFPFSREADVVLNSTLVYETCLLKKHVMPLLEEIPKDDPAYSEAKRIMSILWFFDIIDGDEMVPNNSILKEFIGGSVFTE